MDNKEHSQLLEFSPTNNVISSMFETPEFYENFNNCWRQNSEPVISDNVENKGLKVINSPFNCAYLPNYMMDTKLLQDVSYELDSLDLHSKNNDLFKFRCTNDLGAIDRPNIDRLCQNIKGPIREWIEKITGILLNKKVAISSSKYSYSDTLLCHDDELEGRRIAFILYLCPSWKKTDGGSLDLFSVDDQKRPFSIVERFYPQFNCFAFFEVSPVSFHQVSEVLSENKTRLSVNGWFHGDTLKYPERPILRSAKYITPGEVQEETLYSWINPMYLEQNSQLEIRKEFQDKSEIELPNFLKKRKYDALAEELRSARVKWKWVGPPNKRHVEVLKTSSNIVNEFVSVMHSEAVFLILSQLTGLSLHHLAPDDDDDEDGDEGDDVSDCDDDGEDDVNCDDDSEDDKDITGDVTSAGGAASGSGNDDVHCSRDTGTSQSGASTSHHGPKNNEISPGSEQSQSKDRVSSKTKRVQSEEVFQNTKKRRSETNGYTGEGGLLEGWESDVEGEGPCQKALTEAKMEKTNLKAAVCSEVRRWRWGAYSLMRDDDLQRNENFILDATLFCNGTRNWKAEFGGGIFYVAKGEKTELLTIQPSPNCLALVYRDRETFRFTKHINKKSLELGEERSIYHEIYCGYKEINKS